MTISLQRGLPEIQRSNAWYARAQSLIPAGTQTLAKGPSQFVRGVAPKYLDRGRGSHVWDVDGNEFIDLSMAIGPLSLGYCYPRVDRAIANQLEKGITFSLMHPLEVEVAEQIRTLVPGAEMVRFSKTGADVASAAVRLARAFTGRSKILCAGYHGWHDWYIGTTSRGVGVPSQLADLTRSFVYNDLPSILDQLDQEVAAVILEPTIFQDPKEGFLAELRAACDDIGALLIFDEMWTGFRLALGGAQELYKVRADLACFSKAVANGMPLSVLTGSAEIMRLLDRGVFFFTTFGGETLSLAAAMATLAELQERDVPARLAAQGQKLKAGYNALARKLGLSSTRAVGHPARVFLEFDANAGDPLLQRSVLQQELLRHCVLFGGFHNISYSHSDEDIEHILAAYELSLAVLKTAIDSGDLHKYLLGEPILPSIRVTR